MTGVSYRLWQKMASLSITDNLIEQAGAKQILLLFILSYQDISMG